MDLSLIKMSCGFLSRRVVWSVHRGGQARTFLMAPLRARPRRATPERDVARALGEADLPRLRAQLRARALPAGSPGRTCCTRRCCGRWTARAGGRRAWRCRRSWTGSCARSLTPTGGGAGGSAPCWRGKATPWPRPTPDPERHHAAVQALATLDRLFADDPVALRCCRARRVGCPPRRSGYSSAWGRWITTRRVGACDGCCYVTDWPGASGGTRPRCWTGWRPSCSLPRREGSKGRMRDYPGAWRPGGEGPTPAHPRTAGLTGGGGAIAPPRPAVHAVALVLKEHHRADKRAKVEGQ